MKSPRMAVKDSGVRKTSHRDSRRKRRRARGMVCSRTGVTRTMEKGTWHNWLTEENYL